MTELDEKLGIAKDIYKRVNKALKDLEEYYGVELPWEGPVEVDGYCFIQKDLKDE